MLTQLIQDVQAAARQLVRAPGFSTAAVVTLAIGIGATTAIYSFVDSVLIRPLPYEQEERLVMVCETGEQMPTSWCGASPANWADWRRTAASFDEIGLARSWMLFWRTGDGRFQSVAGGIATAGLFQTFSARPTLGRLFVDADMAQGSEPVAIVSHAFWSSRLGASADVVGRTIELDGTPHRIVGVFADDFAVPDLDWIEVWVPLWPERLSWRGWRGLQSYGRLAPGVSLEQARSELASIHAGLAEQFPDSNAGWGLVVDSLHERTVRSVRPALLLFLAAVFSLLLIACANVANLLMVRSSAKQQEHAVRLAIGARPRHLAWQILCESLLLAAVGCCLGFLLAWWMVDLLRGLAPSWLPRVDQVSVDGRVLVFAMLLALGASLASAMLPMLRVGSRQVSHALRKRDDRSGGSRIRHLLVMGEVALACLLLVLAGLLMRSFATLTRWQPGFDPDNLVMLSLFTPAEGAGATARFQRAVEEVSAIPGVVSAGGGSAVPLLGGDGDQEYLVDGEPVPAAGQRPTVFWYDTIPGYFETLGLPLLQGRFFDEHDTAGAPLVAIVNEVVARRHWPDGGAVGQRLHLLTHDVTFEIVGVVGNVQPIRPDEAPRPAIYWPIAQVPRNAVMVVARVDPGMAGVARDVHDRLVDLDPELDVGRPVPMDERINARLASPRFNMVLLGVFALVAVAIAGLGVAAVVSYSVSRQRREISIRMALGADAPAVLRRIVGQGLLLGVAGALLGLLVAIASGWLLESLLVGVTPTDLTTLAAAALLVIAFSALACYFPARRAAGIDPLEILRHE